MPKGTCLARHEGGVPICVRWIGMRAPEEVKWPSSLITCGVPGSGAPYLLNFRKRCCSSCSPSMWWVTFSRVMCARSCSRACAHTSQRGIWTERLWGATCCHTGCPSTLATHTHTQISLHTQTYDQCSLSVCARVAQTNTNGYHSLWEIKHGCRRTHKSASCHRADIPTHILTHTIPRAQYRVHYCGMPQCFPLNTNCAQTPPGLPSVSNTGLQQTDMIA